MNDVRYPEKRYVVIDAPNVIFHRNTISVERLLKVMAQLREAGYVPIAIIDANIKYPISSFSKSNNTNDFEALSALIERGEVLEAPTGTFADWWMLQFASLQPQAKILSNDAFLEWRKTFSSFFEEDRFIRFMEINGILILDLENISSKKRRKEEVKT